MTRYEDNRDWATCVVGDDWDDDVDDDWEDPDDEDDEDDGKGLTRDMKSNRNHFGRVALRAKPESI